VTEITYENGFTEISGKGFRRQLAAGSGQPRDKLETGGQKAVNTTP